MKEYFKKLCIYYLNHLNKNYYKKTLKEMKKLNLDLQKIDQDVKEYIKILNNKLKEFNYHGTKSDTYSMINKYIKIKDDMDEEDKKTYLEILRSLCMIYNIDLRNELKDYITEIPKPEDIFTKLCIYYLEDQPKEEFDKIKEQGKLINFEELDEKASEIVKSIKIESKKYNLNIYNIESFYNEIDKYIETKDKYNNQEKSIILKTLMLCSKIYNVNLKEEIEQKYRVLDKEKNFLKTLSNPLDNQEFLISYLFQRYNDKSFDISNLSIPDYYKDNNFIEEDYKDIQVQLVFKIISIYLDKLNNYGVDDINPLYVNILSIDDMTRIAELNEDDLSLFIDYINNRIEEDIIFRKLDISDTLYHFLLFIAGITDIFNDNIGRVDKNLFNIRSEKDNIAIYIGTNSSISSYELLSKYIVKCIENNISYNMKNRFNNNIKTILYANKDDLYIKLSILDEIGLENIEIIDTLNRPIASTSIIEDKYYSISTSTISDIEYNEAFDIISEIAYYRILAKLEINKNISEGDKDILNSFIELENIDNNYIKDLSKFYEIKDLINKYIVEISKTLDNYMSSDKNFELLLEEFKKSIIYLFNVIRNKNKKVKNLITLSIEDIS